MLRMVSGRDYERSESRLEANAPLRVPRLIVGHHLLSRRLPARCEDFSSLTSRFGVQSGHHPRRAKPARGRCPAGEAVLAAEASPAALFLSMKDGG